MSDEDINLDDILNESDDDESSEFGVEEAEDILADSEQRWKMGLFTSARCQRRQPEQSRR